MHRLTFTDEDTSAVLIQSPGIHSLNRVVRLCVHDKEHLPVTAT